MEAQFIDDLSNGDLHASWDALLSQTTAAHAQLTHEWLSSCWEVFGEDQRLFLIAVTDGRHIVGIAPLVVRKVIDKAGLELRKLTFVGDGLTDYHDLLIANEKREEIMRVLLECVIKNKDRWDAIHFRNVRGDSPNLPIMREALRETSLAFREQINIQSPYLVIDGDWTEYYSALSKSMRSDIRRQSKRLAEMGKVEFVRLHHVEDVAGVLNTIKSIHVKCRQAQGGASLFANARRFRLASLVAARFSARRALDLAFLKLQDRVIAYYFGFLYDKVVYFWNTGFDPEFSTVSPGKLLLHYGIEDSFRERYRGFDFMVGEEPYKLQWTSLVRPNCELLVFKRTVRSGILKYYHTCKPMLKKVGAEVRSRIRK